VFRVPLMDYLVLPRAGAAGDDAVLTVFADLIGIAGGFVAAMGMLRYIAGGLLARDGGGARPCTQFSTGIIKSVAFAVIVGLTAACAGCSAARTRRGGPGYHLGGCHRDHVDHHCGRRVCRGV